MHLRYVQALFRNPMSWLNIVGCTITFLGCTLYGYVRQVRETKPHLCIVKQYLHLYHDLQPIPCEYECRGPLLFMITALVWENFLARMLLGPKKRCAIMYMYVHLDMNTSVVVVRCAEARRSCGCECIEGRNPSTPTSGTRILTNEACKCTACRTIHTRSIPHAPPEIVAAI